MTINEALSKLCRERIEVFYKSRIVFAFVLLEQRSGNFIIKYSYHNHNYFKQSWNENRSIDL